MFHEILGDLLLFGGAVALSFALNFRGSLAKWHLLLLFLVIGLADNLAYALTSAIPGLQLIETRIWNNFLECNWSAKLYSVLFALLTLLVVRDISRDDLGLHWRQKKGSLLFSLGLLAFFLVVGIFVGTQGNKGEMDLNVLLFLAVMPGINEELIYRGFLLGILDKIFPKKWKMFGTNFGWGAIISSLVFGLLHGFQITPEEGIQLLHLTNVVLTSMFGFLFALMKERSGSLLFPVIGHGLLDFVQFLIRML